MLSHLLFNMETDRFEVQSYELPALRPEEVRVRLELAALKHGTEAHAWSGPVNRGRRWDPQRRLFLDPPAAGATPGRTRLGVGNMAVGVITETGAAVEGLRTGQRVFGYMPVRQVHQLLAARVRPLPEDLAPEGAVCVDPAHVAFVALRDGNVRLGDDVAVFGLGAIGLLAVQAARAAGASQVFAVDPLGARRERALYMGASQAFDPSVGDTALAIKEATAQCGVDVSIETSGVDAALREAIRCIRQCGTVVAVGWGSGSGAGLYLGEEFHVNRPTIVASQASSYWGNPDRDHPLWDEARAQHACVDLFRRGALSPRGVLDPIVNLLEAPAALEAVRSDPGRVLKVGIRF